jgi:hypothetical protein
MGIGWMGSISHSLFSSALLGPAIPWSPRNDRYGHKKNVRAVFLVCSIFWPSQCQYTEQTTATHVLSLYAYAQGGAFIYNADVSVVVNHLRCHSKLRSLKMEDNFKTLLSYVWISALRVRQPANSGVKVAHLFIFTNKNLFFYSSTPHFFLF